MGPLFLIEVQGCQKVLLCHPDGGGVYCIKQVRFLVPRNDKERSSGRRMGPLLLIEVQGYPKVLLCHPTEEGAIVLTCLDSSPR
jgi:hypothetical protein